MWARWTTFPVTFRKYLKRVEIIPLKILRKHNFSLSARAPKEQTGSKNSIGHVIGCHGNIVAKFHTYDTFPFEDRPPPLLF